MECRRFCRGGQMKVPGPEDEHWPDRFGFGFCRAQGFGFGLTSVPGRPARRTLLTFPSLCVCPSRAFATTGGRYDGSHPKVQRSCSFATFGSAASDLIAYQGCNDVRLLSLLRTPSADGKVSLDQIAGTGPPRPTSTSAISGLAARPLARLSFHPRLRRAGSDDGVTLRQ